MACGLSSASGTHELMCDIQSLWWSVSQHECHEALGSHSQLTELLDLVMLMN